jgi:DnaJ-class molecular chaperone
MNERMILSWRTSRSTHACFTFTYIGVSHDADTRTIKKAFRKLAYETHPDRVGPEQKEDAEKRMAELNAAYEVLSDGGK